MSSENKREMVGKHPEREVRAASRVTPGGNGENPFRIVLTYAESAVQPWGVHQHVIPADGSRDFLLAGDYFWREEEAAARAAFEKRARTWGLLETPVQVAAYTPDHE